MNPVSTPIPEDLVGGLVLGGILGLTAGVIGPDRRRYCCVRYRFLDLPDNRVLENVHQGGRARLEEPDPGL